MENLLENLNKEQLAAVMHKDGPLLIVAGAGTGKTTVITQRIAYLIEQGCAQPEEILALTFTEKAAEEMSERVDRLLPIGYLDLWISTFHSFGEKILREHGIAIGLPGDFKLLNEFEQYSLIKKNLDKLDLNYYRPMGNPTKFVHALIKHFSRAKDEDISPEQYLGYAEDLKQNLDAMLSGAKRKRSTKPQIPNPKQIQNSKFKIPNAFDSEGKFSREIAEQEIMRINEVANAYHVYQQLLLDNSALDFGDLINFTIKMFRERPAILESYRRQFKYILLDEFQDTNWAQYELIKMLVGPKENLVVVGDDDQSIYKFRGASVSNILQFKKDFPKSQQIFLTHNYRNTQGILDLSYEFIKLNNPNRLEYQLAQNEKSKIKDKKLSKKLIANNKEVGAVEVIQGEDLDDEVRLVIEKIADLKVKDKKSAWNDFAILVRANDSAKEFCNALEIAGLPYLFLSSRGLYAKPIIMDVVAYFKLLDDYHESSAMYRVLNIPIFDFAYREIVNFNFWANKKAWSLYEVLKNIAVLNLGIELQKKADIVLSLIEKHSALAR
jgi:DNA helicase-2/ATP-dependent DNA helicase PcrA